MTRRHKRWVLLGIAAVLAGAVLEFRKPLQNWAFATAILHKPGPNEQQLYEVVHNAPTISDGLIDLWSSGMMPHRHYVLQILGEDPTTAHDRWGEFRPPVLDAVASRDCDLMEPGMRILCLNSREEAASAAAALLEDADPESRVNGIRAISSMHDMRFFDRVVDCLADSEQAVQVQASLALTTMCGKDVAVRFNDPASVAHAARQYRDAAPTRPASSAMPTAFGYATSPIAAPWVTVNDVAGHPVNLNELHGRPVLLNFWATWCAPCKQELPELVKLQRQHPEVAIIGICADAVRDDDGDGGATPEESLPKMLQAMQRYKMTWPNILDRTGSIVSSYDGSGVPLNVLIDSTGIVRRRFVGSRSVAAMGKMIASLPKQ